MLLENCPELQSIVDLISAENPLQKKRIEAFFATRDSEYWRFSEDLSRTLNQGFLTSDVARQDAAKSYNKMCMDFLSAQISFRKTGKYRIDDSAVAETEVYNDLEVMRYYMVGLLMSYMFWPIHYELFRVFLQHLPENDIGSYLEVGVGHGLFSSTLLTRFPEVKGTVVDISKMSIQTAREVMKAFDADTSRLNFIHGDYLKADLGGLTFDFVIMGEVLEHVNDAPGFMARTKNLVAQEGKVYLSTCANCPALDHVYHFHSADEIRDLITGAGFNIISDLALPAEDVPEEDWEKELVTINYCCLLEHA